MESIRSPKEYLEDVLGNMTLKGIPFSILQAATDVDFLEQTLSQLDEQFLDMNNMTDLPKFPKVSEFYQKHCISRTYFLQVRKCNDNDCAYQKPICGSGEVNIFPDPVPKEVDSVLHYEPGSDPEEKF